MIQLYYYYYYTENNINTINKRYQALLLTEAGSEGGSTSDWRRCTPITRVLLQKNSGQQEPSVCSLPTNQVRGGSLFENVGG